MYCLIPVLLMQRRIFHINKVWCQQGAYMLRRSLRDIIVYDELFDVGQFLMEILAAFLLLPVAWELLWGRERAF